MAQQTAVEWLLLNLEVPFPKINEYKLIIELAKQMEKEQIINSQMDMFHHINNMPYGLDYLTKRDSAEKFAKKYGGQGSPDTTMKEKTKNLLEAAKPLIEYLNNTYHPHCKIIVECDSVEVVEGVEISITKEFIKD